MNRTLILTTTFRSLVLSGATLSQTRSSLDAVTTFAHLAQSSGMQRRRSVRPAERLRMGSSIAQIKS